MSLLSTLPRERREPHAFSGFHATGLESDLGTALAMTWTCQLAYETADPLEIASITADWNMTIPTDGIISAESATVLPRSITPLVAGQCGGAIIVALADTDPISIANGIKDFMKTARIAADPPQADPQ
jgi:hypothetical protein